MNNIKFEGLGLDLNINPVMVDINGIKIYWYSFIIIIIMGVAICLLLCRRDDGKYKIKEVKTVENDSAEYKRLCKYI